MPTLPLQAHMEAEPGQPLDASHAAAAGGLLSPPQRAAAPAAAAESGTPLDATLGMDLTSPVPWSTGQSSLSAGVDPAVPFTVRSASRLSHSLAFYAEQARPGRRTGVQGQLVGQLVASSAARRIVGSLVAVAAGHRVSGAFIGVSGLRPSTG